MEMKNASLACFLFVAMIAGSSQVYAQSVPCLSFEDFDEQDDELSPVVAPPGSSIPSDILLEWSQLPFVNAPGYYKFIKPWEGVVNSYQGTVLGNGGTLIISLSAPNNMGVFNFDLVHFNQPDIEVRVFNMLGIELTSGWKILTASPDPVTGLPPSEGKKYPISDFSYFGNTIGKIMVRNTSTKSGFVGFCII